MCCRPPAAHSGGTGETPRTTTSATAPTTSPPPAHHQRKCAETNDIQQTFAGNGLVRPRDHRVLGGVCAGLGRRFGLDPWAARILFVLVLMVLPGSQLLVYPILWILMPSEEYVTYAHPTQPTPPPPPAA